MNIFKRLTTRKSEIEREISIRKSETLEAQKALALVARLEAELPGKIEAIKAAPCDIMFGASVEDYDFHGSGAINGQADFVESAERLLADLPEIKKHWLARAKQLAD